MLGGTFLIFQRLIDLKAFVQDLGSQESYLNESEMLQVFEIFYAATIPLQKQELTTRMLACFIEEK